MNQAVSTENTVSPASLRIAFIDNFILNFGVSYLSSTLKGNRHEVILFDWIFSKTAKEDIYVEPERYYDFPSLADEVLAARPDVLCFSVWSPNFQFYKRLAAEIRSRSAVPIVVGGVLPTLRPDLFIPDTACDVVFRGEAEPVIEDLVQAAVRGDFSGVPNVVTRGPDGTREAVPLTSYVNDLEALPFRDHELYPNNSRSLFVLTSRGCVMKCAYCSAGTFSRTVVPENSKLVRKRSARSVIDELKNETASGKYKEIFFYDDFFITSQEWLAEFAALYKVEINLPYYCIAFPATVTPAIAAILAESGCKGVLMGFQTANEEYKRRVLARNEPVKSVLRAIEALRQSKVKVSLDHIFNFPGETEDDIELSMNFYIDNKIDSLMLFFLNYYPDSALTKWAHDNHFLNDDQFERISRNELVGEQSFRGTVIDQTASDRQIQWAILFRLINLVPGPLVKWLFRHKVYRFFPTGRGFYYALSGVAMIKGMGVLALLNTLYLAFGLNGQTLRKIVLRRAAARN